MDDITLKVIGDPNLLT